MFRGSPSYSPPRRRARSPSYSPPRARRFSPVRRRERSRSCNRDGVSPPRGRPLPSWNRSSRSRSPSYSSRNRTRSKSRSRSRSPLSKPGCSTYPWQDEETLRTLHCKDCDVYLHDRWEVCNEVIAATLFGVSHIYHLIWFHAASGSQQKSFGVLTRSVFFKRKYCFLIFKELLPRDTIFEHSVKQTF